MRKKRVNKRVDFLGWWCRIIIINKYLPPTPLQCIQQTTTKPNTYLYTCLWYCSNHKNTPKSQPFFPNLCLAPLTTFLRVNRLFHTFKCITAPHSRYLRSLSPVLPPSVLFLSLLSLFSWPPCWISFFVFSLPCHLVYAWPCGLTACFISHLFFHLSFFCLLKSIFQ